MQIDESRRDDYFPGVQNVGELEKAFFSSSFFFLGGGGERETERERAEERLKIFQDLRC